MTFFITIFAITIIFGLAFIVKTLSWWFKQEKYLGLELKVISKRSNVITIEDALDYIQARDIDKIGRYGPSGISQQYVHDEKHLKSLTEDMVRRISRNLLHSKVVEIKDIGHEDNFNIIPYHRRLSIRLRVLQPEQQ